MPARARKEIVDETEVGFYHCTSRCVRRAFLCGDDAYTGKNYDHRKTWIEERLQQLSAVMAVELTAFAVMDNHLHLVLRNRPDVVATWSDAEVARRWLRICPGERMIFGQSSPEPTKEQVDALVRDGKTLAKVRKQLSSISWYHRFLKEDISRWANAEDGVSGAFWEGRFRSTRLLDFYALLLCSMYVDLNPVRAGVAETPEASTHTSAWLRIQARKRRGSQQAAAWLAPIDESSPPPDAGLGKRATDEGYLPMTLDDYLRCLDWCGREVRRGKRGRIPPQLAPILKRLQVDGETWISGVQEFGRMFAFAAGTPRSLKQYTARKGLRWCRGMTTNQHSGIPMS